MSRDPLTSLVRLRRAACDDAHHSVVCCIAAENRAQSAAREAEREITREMHAASDLSGTDADVEAFAAWLPGARSRAEVARTIWDGRQAETARARASLSACRIALETVETLLHQRLQAKMSADACRWQGELDEASRLSGQPAQQGDTDERSRQSGP